MEKKILIPLHGNNVASRFDLATEVLIAQMSADGKVEQERTVVLPQASAEDLCHLVITEGIETVVCGGIEDEHYQYLTWKRVRVVDSVIGPYDLILERFSRGFLKSGEILFHREKAVRDGV